MRGFNNCIIIIHDFDNGKFGHITYDGESLSLKVVNQLLRKVNPKFRFYTNTKCNIMKPEETEDPIILDNLNYAWSKADKGKRGILYALPREIPRKFKEQNGLRFIR